MRKWFILSAFIVLLISCKAPILQYEFPAVATKLAQDHEVAIGTVFYMGETEYNARIENAKKGTRGIRYLEGIVPLGRITYLLGQKGDVYAIVYLGAGGIIKDNHVLTVRHLFEHEENTISRRIFVWQKDAMLPAEAELVAITEGKVFHDDYALIRMTTPMGLPGLKLATMEGRDGEPIIFIGSTGGMAFHTRYGLLTHASRFFEKSEETLALNRWDDFDLVMTYPGGPGDSGGIIVNTKGELLGIMYCGVTVYSEEYIFTNPIMMAWTFLGDNKLDGLAR